MEPISVSLILLGKAVLTKLGITSTIFTAEVVGLGVVAVGIAVVGTLVYISYLVLSDLISWFRGKKTYKRSDTHAVSLKAELRSGKRVVVQGVFDGDGDPVSPNAARTIEYNSMSPEMEKLHREGIVEYT